MVKNTREREREEIERKSENFREKERCDLNFEREEIVSQNSPPQYVPNRE